MGKITLNEALKKASVKNDLQMFLGLDAQSELGGMTPERLAAVAGELHYKQQTLLTSKDDLNDINDGLYYYEGPEKPANSSQVNSILTQISHCKRKDIIQIEICIQNSVIRYRTYSISTSVWTEWKMFR